MEGDTALFKFPNAYQRFYVSSHIGRRVAVTAHIRRLQADRNIGLQRCAGDAVPIGILILSGNGGNCDTDLLTLIKIFVSISRCDRF